MVGVLVSLLLVLDELEQITKTGCWWHTNEYLKALWLVPQYVANLVPLVQIEAIDSAQFVKHFLPRLAHVKLITDPFQNHLQSCVCLGMKVTEVLHQRCIADIAFALDASVFGR